ncbi:sodium:calcium antiporter [Dongia sp. agr-C8]
MIWLGFIVCMALIFFGGRRLSRLADALAARTGIEGSWIGLTLLSSITSAPELMTGLASVTLADAPDIAMGDIMGSCAFNVAILALVHFTVRRQTPLFAELGGHHVLPAAFSAMLIGVVTMELAARQFGVHLQFLQTGAFVPVVLVLYMLGMRMIFRDSATTRASSDMQAATPADAEVPLSPLLAQIAFAGAAVIAGGVGLPFVATDIADTLGWSHSFVGTLLVAAVTSAPEITVTLAAARIGALDMAVANVFGSNMFNIVVIAIDDLAYRPGPLLAAVNPAHAFSGLTAIVMTTLAIIGLSYRRASGAYTSVTVINAGLVLLFLGNAALLFYSGR